MRNARERAAFDHAARQRADAEGWEVVAEVVERASASRHGRPQPGLDRLIEMTAGGEVDVVLVRDFAELSRDVRAFEALIDAADPQDRGYRHPVVVEFLDGSPGIDLASADGRHTARCMIAGIARRADAIAERVRAAKAIRQADQAGRQAAQVREMYRAVIDGGQVSS
jgi:DNA invertase Pin-like site-specific DNA recombinase